jgi:probable HAF family extracellular repeat protein
MKRVVFSWGSILALSLPFIPSLVFAAYVGLGVIDLPDNEFILLDTNNTYETQSFVGVDINNAGQVVGTILNDYEYRQAFIWSATSGFQLIGTLGGNWSAAFGINNLGQVVGQSQIASSNYYHAFFWSEQGGFVDLGTLGATASSAYAVNDAGQVVGVDTLNSHRGFFWSTETGIINIGTLGYSTGTRLFGINNQGKAVGYSSPVGADRHAIVWSLDNGIIDLIPTDMPPYHSYSEAYDINDLGMIVGRAPRQIGDTWRGNNAVLWNDDLSMSYLEGLPAETHS